MGDDRKQSLFCQRSALVKTRKDGTKVIFPFCFDAGCKACKEEKRKHRIKEKYSFLKRYVSYIRQSALLTVRIGEELEDLECFSKYLISVCNSLTYHEIKLPWHRSLEYDQHLYHSHLALFFLDDTPLEVVHEIFSKFADKHLPSGNEANAVHSVIFDSPEKCFEYASKVNYYKADNQMIPEECKRHQQVWRPSSGKMFEEAKQLHERTRQKLQT